MKGLIFWSSLAGLFMILLPLALYDRPIIVLGVGIPLCAIVAWIWTELLFNNYFWR